MTATESAHLADVAEVLEASGYVVEMREMAGSPAVLAESPYALIACSELEQWRDLEEHVFDLQAALTRIGEDEPSARSWDLYVVVLVNAPTHDAEHRALVETIEADTRYARKFVRVGVGRHDLDRALRPLLPLRPPAGLAITDPMAELQAELLALDVASDLATAAVASFALTDTVEVP